MGNDVPTAPPPPPGTTAPPAPPTEASEASPPAPPPAEAPEAEAVPAPVPVASAPAPASPQPQATDVSEQTLLIPPSMIDLMDGQQHRISRDQSKQAELTASIKANGQNDPIKVMKNGNRFLLVYGHGRLQAIKDLGIEKIRAELFIGNQQEAALLALSENVNREELNPIEIALGIREAMKRGASLPEVAAKLGKTTEEGSPDVVWVEQHLELLSLNQKQRDEVANNMMSKTTAHRLAKMSSDNRDKIFEEMEKITEGKKKPNKPKGKKGEKGKAKKDSAPPPPPPPAKKTGATLEKAQAKVTGKSKDKFIGTKAAREVYKEIKGLHHDYIPTDEKTVIDECLHLIDYLLGKKKTKPFQLDIE